MKNFILLCSLFFSFNIYADIDVLWNNFVKRCNEFGAYRTLFNAAMDLMQEDFKRINVVKSESEILGILWIKPEATGTVEHYEKDVLNTLHMRQYRDFVRIESSKLKNLKLNLALIEEKIAVKNFTNLDKLVQRTFRGNESTQIFVLKTQLRELEGVAILFGELVSVLPIEPIEPMVASAPEQED